MDRPAGAAGLSELKEVMLVQTDTTVGFASQNAAALSACKARPSGKPFLKTFASLRAYKKTSRVPQRFKRELRRRERTTYVVKNRAFRIVPHGPYHRILSAFGWCYSTSANASGARYDPLFAHAQAAIVVEDRRGLFEDVPSNIYKLNTKKKRRIR